MKNGGGAMEEWVMCSTCSGFVARTMRADIPNPDDEVVEVVTEADEEVVKEAEKMRDLMEAVLLHGPLQEIEPAQATKEQRQVLQRRRRIMTETKKCPTCSGSPLLEETERKKIAAEYEAAVADFRSDPKWLNYDQMLLAARSDPKLKQSWEEDRRSIRGLKEKKKAESEPKEGSGSENNKAKRSSEMEGSRSKEAKMKGSGLKESWIIDDLINWDRTGCKTMIETWRLNKKTFELMNGPSVNEPPVKSQLKKAKMEDSESAVGNRKTKMVTERLDKKAIDIFSEPHPKPPIEDLYYVDRNLVDFISARDDVDRLFAEYLKCHYSVKGYAEYQVELTDDECDDHKLV